MAVKEQLLEYLERHREEPISGQALADRLGVSRAAVWKAAKRLEEEGHRITAGTNRGYQLETQSDLLSPQGMRCHLLPAWRECPIITERSVDSTNTLAKKLAADGAEDGTVILAEEQTAGRGRMGRDFYSPAGTGLYMSLLLRPRLPAAELSVVTIAAAAAVCEAIEALTGLETGVKWVNDILVAGKKVSGILTEAVTDCESGMADSVIVGIGVNVATPMDAFPEKLRSVAGSLLPARVSRNRLAAGIVNRLRDYAGALPARRFIEPYRSRSAALGKPVLFARNGGWAKGVAAGIDDNGALMVKTAEGDVLLRAGEIKLLEGFS